LIQIPEDGTVAVITMDVRGGYRLPRVDNRPWLTIFADGTVRVIDDSGKVAPIEAKISAEELQDLLRFAIVEQQFFDFDSQTALRELHEEQRKIDIGLSMDDNLLTVIRIRTAERDHTGEFYALDEYATIFRALKPLANFQRLNCRGWLGKYGPGEKKTLLRR